MSKLTPSEQARRLFKEKLHGVLSTVSKEIPDYPFGSLTPYVGDYQENPILLISDIAEHHQNISNNPKVCLTIVEGEGGEVQAKGRISIVGDAIKLTAENETEAAERYFSFFPYARNYRKAHHFDFFRIDVKRVRYIGGFGKIFWVEKNEFCTPNLFTPEKIKGIVDHMNEDHVEALKHYLLVFKGMHTPVKEIQMASIDQEGFDVLADKEHYRFSFEKPLENVDQAREVLVSMARAPVGAQV